MSEQLPVLVDQAARQRAITGLDASMAISAGAGSGKTSVLAGRIVHCLQTGVAPSSIAAMTFTEKAAGELLVRVRDLLETRLAAGSDDDATRQHLSAALASFGSLSITTIHGFCRDVLRHEAFSAGFAPDTTVGDDVELAALATAAITQWRRKLRQKWSQVWHVVDEKVSPSALLEAVLHLERYRSYASLAASEDFDLAIARAGLQPLIAAVSAAAKRCQKRETCKLIGNNQGFIDLVGTAVDGHGDDDRDLLALLLSTVAPTLGVGRQGDWDVGGREAYRDALTAIADWRARWLVIAHGVVVRELATVVVPAVLESKRRHGVADFDDLLIEAARVLRDDDDARQRLAARYRVVLIDEVQDTDPIQAEVALLLTRAIDGEGPEAGRLFAVGDPRQSIYRFRGADFSTFSALENRIVAAGERQVLRTNFRSAGGIVDWVNHVYSDLPGYQAQSAWRGTAALDPVVLIHNDARNADTRTDEIDAVIGHLRELFASNAVVVDSHTGAARPLRSNDVMILLPSWGKADALADRLRAAQLSCVVEGGGAFYDRDEVRLLVAALRVIAEPADTEAAAFVLRGVFGLSIEALAVHIAAGGTLRCTVPAPQAGAVADALAVLLKLHRRRGHQAASSLLQSLLSSTRTLAVWALLADGAARSANIDKLLSIVRTLEAEHAGLLAVVDVLSAQARSRKGDKDIDRVDDDGDAIRITTLFKAKGLEAPVVCVMHATRGTDQFNLVVDHLARTVIVKVGTLVPAGWDALKDAEHEAAEAERRRWMYVAATRARDQLVVCRTLTSSARSTLLDLDIAPHGLPDADAVPAHDGLWSPSTAPSVLVRVRHALTLRARLQASTTCAVAGLDARVDALLTQPAGVGDVVGDAWQRGERAAITAAQRGAVRWRAASAARASSSAASSSAASSSAASSSAASSPAAPVMGAGLAVGARVGLVVHAVMERLDLSQAIADLVPVAHALATQLAAQASLSKADADVAVAVVTRILANPKLALARSAPERWHEVPFTFMSGSGVVAGTIDLCFPLDAQRRRWAVFDWKSTAPPPGSPQRARYEAQLAQYAKALLKNVGDIVVEVAEIVGPHHELGPVTTIDEQLAEVPERWRAAVTAVVARGAPLPDVGVDLEEDLAAVAELAWLEQKVAVGIEVDATILVALQARGWRVFAELSELAAALGVAAVSDGNVDSDDDSGDMQE